MTDNSANLNKILRPHNICICSSVSEKQIVEAIHSGCDTLEKISQKTSACTTCKTCKKDILQILSKELAK